MKKISRLFKTSVVAIVVQFIVAGCQAPGPSLGEAMTIAHFDVLKKAEAQQKYFRQHVRPGMTKEQVKQLAVRTSRSVQEGWYRDGQPENVSFKVVNNTTYELWEYSYYNKVFVLTFQNGKLSSLTDRPGVTPMDNM